MCGGKLSLCCMLISIWGFVQLTIMGFLYYNHAPALFEDLGHVSQGMHLCEFYENADMAYEQAAYNCWIAACLFFITIAFGSFQFYKAAHDAMIEDND
uniref:CSON001552 protein n=1 Tax=Culicoides sonorensis TaxID=179676 RepID=A0A336L0P8_CULSO